MTPLSTTSSPGFVSSQLPPVSAARSTMTEPDRIARTAASGMSFGAGSAGNGGCRDDDVELGQPLLERRLLLRLLLGGQLGRVAALGLLAAGCRGRGTSRRATPPAPSRRGARRTRRRRRRGGGRWRAPAGRRRRRRARAPSPAEPSRQRSSASGRTSAAARRPAARPCSRPRSPGTRGRPWAARA